MVYGCEPHGAVQTDKEMKHPWENIGCSNKNCRAIKQLYFTMGESVHKKNRCFFQIFEPCARFIIREGNETRKDKTEGKKWEEEEGKGRENNRNRKEPNQGLAPSLLLSSLRIL